MQALSYGSPLAMAAPVAAPIKMEKSEVAKPAATDRLSNMIRLSATKPALGTPSRVPLHSNGHRLCSTPKIVRAAGGVRNHASQTPKTTQASTGMRNHAMGIAPGIALSQVVSRSCWSGNLQQLVVVWDIPLSRPSRVDSTVRYSTTLGKLWQRQIHRGGIRCQLGGASSSQEDEIGPNADVPSTSGGNDMVEFDLDLPRRSLLVEFTCNVCGARTQRTINPGAYRRGTVYVQCGGCEAHHQLVDNLDLVKEYDFRNEGDPSTNDLGV